MAVGRPKSELTISQQEREDLERLTRRTRVNRQVAFRARIVLLCADGISNTDVARQLRTSNATVGKWRKRFLEKRVDGLLDEPRPGAPRTIADEEIEKVVVQTLESLPEGRTHWSTRSMAKQVGLSHSTIGRIWRAFGLKPHVSERFQLSKDPSARGKDA